MVPPQYEILQGNAERRYGEDELIDALASGRVAAAAVDVFATEPVPPGDPLVGHPRIVATPHVSAFTTEAIHRETSQVLEDIVNVLSNRPVAHMG